MKNSRFHDAFARCCCRLFIGTRCVHTSEKGVMLNTLLPEVLAVVPVLEHELNGLLVVLEAVRMDLKK